MKWRDFLKIWRGPADFAAKKAAEVLPQSDEKSQAQTKRLTQNSGFLGLDAYVVKRLYRLMPHSKNITSVGTFFRSLIEYPPANASGARKLFSILPAIPNALKNGLKYLQVGVSAIEGFLSISAKLSWESRYYGGVLPTVILGAGVYILYIPNRLLDHVTSPAIIYKKTMENPDAQCEATTKLAANFLLTHGLPSLGIISTSNVIPTLAVLSDNILGIPVMKTSIAALVALGILDLNQAVEYGAFDEMTDVLNTAINCYNKAIDCCNKAVDCCPAPEAQGDLSHSRSQTYNVNANPGVAVDEKVLPLSGPAVPALQSQPTNSNVSGHQKRAPGSKSAPIGTATVAAQNAATAAAGTAPPAAPVVNIQIPQPVLVNSNSRAAQSDGITPTQSHHGLDYNISPPSQPSSPSMGATIGEPSHEPAPLNLDGPAPLPQNGVALPYAVNIAQPLAAQQDHAARLFANQEQLLVVRQEMQAEAKAKAAGAAYLAPSLPLREGMGVALRAPEPEIIDFGTSANTTNATAPLYAAAGSPQSQPLAGHTPSSLDLGKPANPYRRPVLAANSDSKSQREVDRAPNLTPTPPTPQHPQPQPAGNLPPIRGLTPTPVGSDNKATNQDINFSSSVMAYFTTAIKIGLAAARASSTPVATQVTHNVPVQPQTTAAAPAPAAAVSVDQKIQAIQAGSDDKQRQHEQIRQLRASGAAANPQAAAAATTNTGAAAAVVAQHPVPSMGATLLASGGGGVVNPQRVVQRQQSGISISRSIAPQSQRALAVQDQRFAAAAAEVHAPLPHVVVSGDGSDGDTSSSQHRLTR